MINDFPTNYYVTAIFEVEPDIILIAAQSNFLTKTMVEFGDMIFCIRLWKE